ncbi:hypothetical protein H4219_005031 [Mycoemilia scoparia]|uniref:Major facilitator superfamily (MFS) profile domain-containing protein n=1 Tax=Mycoemilia scoparia TaxID=417184 RepID=A0A9W7ZPJ8_9FUNG|nr:hypothetical protein H4219_005031 [Mycoemilia scoparia]
MLFAFFKRIRMMPISVVVAATVCLFVETVIYDMCISVIPALLEKVLHISGDHNGQLSGLTAISKTASSLGMGYLSDKLGRRKLPLLATGFGYFIMAFFFWRSGAYWQLVVARIAQGVTGGATWTIIPGMVADVYSGETMGSRLAVAYTGSQMAHILGPVVGGFVFDHYSNTGVAALIMGLALLDLFFKTLILPESLELKRYLYNKVGSSEMTSVNGGPGSNTSNSAATTVLPSIAPTGGDLPPISTSLSNNLQDRRHSGAEPSNSIPLQVLRQYADDSDNEDNDDDRPGMTATNAPQNTNNSPPPPAIQMSAWQLFKVWPIQAYNIGSVSVVLISSLLETALPLELSQRYGLSAGGIGAIFIALGVPSMLSAAPIGWFISQPKVQAYLYPFNRWGIISLSILLNIICLFFLGWTNSTFEVMIDLALVSILHPFITVPVMTGLAQYLQDINCTSFAQCYSLNQMAQSLAAIMFPMLVAWLYKTNTFATTSAIIASMCFGLAILVSVTPILHIIRFGRHPAPTKVASRDNAA